jgi:predicted kinase
MFTRTLEVPRTSCFLFGARGTGKSTWIRARFDDPFVVNLLASDQMLRYQRDPSLFRDEVLAQPAAGGS